MALGFPEPLEQPEFEPSLVLEGQAEGHQAASAVWCA